jgi:hypothetical protein
LPDIVLHNIQMLFGTAGFPALETVKTRRPHIVKAN